ncbi:hypothetical protein FHG87_015540 [Trinorchestia longiramus]|nr:hypothetical protein FHG87_015540 [Trinorchestia longiramus]
MASSCPEVWVQDCRQFDRVKRPKSCWGTPGQIAHPDSFIDTRPNAGGKGIANSLPELVQSSQQVQQQQHLSGDSEAVVLDGGGGGGVDSGSGSGSGSGTERCAKKRLQQCLSLLQTLSTDHNLAFAADEQQLKEMCKTMRSGLTCVNDHVSLCFEPRHRQRIKQLLMGTEKTVHLLCHKGPLREKYLKHAPCMRNVSTDTELCGSHYQALISSVDVKDNLSSQDTIRQQCCAFHTYLACVGVAAERRCGQSAGRFVEEYSYRTAGTIILTRCRGYQPGSAMCSHAPSAAAAPPPLLLLLVVAGILATAFSA